MADEEDSHTTPGKALDTQSISLLNGNQKPLSTPCNLISLFFFTFFSNAAYAVFAAIALLKYVSWGLTLIDTVNAGLIFLTVNNFTQAIVGIYGDKVVTKYGRRKIFVMVGTIIRIISILFICSPPVKHTNLIFTWYVIFGSLHQIGFGILNNPFASWMIESTIDENDYMKINIITGFLAGLSGGLLGVIMVSITPLLTSIFIAIGGVASLIGIVVYVPTTAYRQSPIVPKPIPSLRMCVQSQEFRTILYMSIAINTAQSMYGGLVLFILATCFGLNSQAFVLSLTIAGAVIGSILGVFLLICCIFILKKIEKIRVLVILLWLFIGLSISIFFLTLSKATLYPYLIVTIMMGILAMPGGFILNLMLRDLVIFDTFVTRYNRENMFLTSLGIPSSIIASFIAALPIVVLTLSGFKSNDVDDDNLHNLYTWDAVSLWIMRISSSFICAGFGILAYYLVRNYPLTQKVCDKINKVVKHREQVRESGDLELRSDIQGGIATKSTENESFATTSLPEGFENDEVTITNDERETLLHLSVFELYRVYAAIDSQVYRPEQGVFLIKQLLKYGFGSAIFAILMMIIALVFNTIYLQGLFSTLIIYFVLIVAFYAFYEFFRYTTIRQLLAWNATNLKLKAKKVYEEFTKKGDNLALMLSREGIYVDTISNEDEQDEMLGIAPKSIIANDLKEDDLAEEAFVGLNGYKRIFVGLFVLSALSLVLIVVSVAN